MASIREQIILAAKASLLIPGGPAGLNVYRERQRPIEFTSLPACVLYAEDDEPRPFDGNHYKSPLVERAVTIRVECRAQGDQSTPADAALDPIIVWVVKQFFKDETFGGLANGVVEGRTAWLSAEGDVTVAAAAISFTIRYRTSRLDPTSQS